MEKKSKNKAVKSGIFIAVFVLSIMIIGVSVSYAYFSANVVGSSDTGENKAAKLNVTTTLTSGGAINATSLAIIDGSEYLTKAEHFEVTVTNNTDSTVRAKYAINLTDITISKNILSKYLGLKVILIPCAGGDDVASQREQWNDGTNTLCIAPGVVVVYNRNNITNDVLRSHGIKVIEMSSAELSRGRGGPRCMSMPLSRED